MRIFTHPRQGNFEEFCNIDEESSMEKKNPKELKNQKMYFFCVSNNQVSKTRQKHEKRFLFPK